MARDRTPERMNVEVVLSQYDRLLSEMSILRTEDREWRAAHDLKDDNRFERVYETIEKSVAAGVATAIIAQAATTNIENIKRDLFVKQVGAWLGIAVSAVLGAIGIVRGGPLPPSSGGG